MDAKKVALYFSFVLLFVLGLYSVGKLLDKSNLEYITDLWNSFSGFLITNGPLLFLAITFLPALILPVSPLLALAGIWGNPIAFYLPPHVALLPLLQIAFGPIGSLEYLD